MTYKTEQEIHFAQVVRERDEARAACAQMRTILTSIETRMNAQGFARLGSYKFSNAQLYEDDLKQITAALQPDCGKLMLDISNQMKACRVLAKVPDDETL